MHTRHDALHDKQGHCEGGCAVFGSLVQRLLPPGCVVLWKGLLQNGMQCPRDLQLPAHMQDLHQHSAFHIEIASKHIDDLSTHASSKTLTLTLSSMSLGAFTSLLQHEQGASNHVQARHKERASIGDVQVSKRAERTARHMGHLLEWSMLRAKQVRQKVWPQGVVTGSKSSFRHKMQSVSSQLTTFLLHIAQALAQAVSDMYKHTQSLCKVKAAACSAAAGRAFSECSVGFFLDTQVPILNARVYKAVSLQRLPMHSEVHAQC